MVQEEVGVIEERSCKLVPKAVAVIRVFPHLKSPVFSGRRYYKNFDSMFLKLETKYFDDI